MTSEYERLLKVYEKKIDDLRLKCIVCSEPADHIFTVMGTGGSFCKKHLVEAQERRDKLSDDLQKKMEDTKSKH